VFDSKIVNKKNNNMCLILKLIKNNKDLTKGVFSFNLRGECESVLSVTVCSNAKSLFTFTPQVKLLILVHVNYTH